MPRAPGAAFPLVSLKVEGSYAIRWQSLEPCPDGEGFDIKRHYDEKFYLDGTRTAILHYCPSRQRTIDCQVSSELFPWHESYSEALIESDDADWEVCETIEVDPETCEPVGEVPEGCSFLLCPPDADCFDSPEYPDDVFQIWERPVIEEQVTIGIGPFTNVEKLTNRDWEGETASFWWARGIGKIKEISVGIEEEELVDYCLPRGPNAPLPPFEPNLADRCPTAQ